MDAMRSLTTADAIQMLMYILLCACTPADAKCIGRRKYPGLGGFARQHHRRVGEVMGALFSCISAWGA